MSKVIITDAIKKEAQKIGKQLGVSELFVNTKGEFFTQENLALFSVKGDKESYEKLTVSIAAEAKEVKAPSAEYTAASKKLTAAKGALTKAENALTAAKGDKKPAAQAAFDEAKQLVIDAENDLAQLKAE